jgi:release factor glutamine methyltransferase
MTASDLLRTSCLDALDARILLAYALGWRRTELITRADIILDPERIQAYQRLEHCRQAGMPIAQLTGTKEFFGLEFRITPAVLIPRPETELLVELSLKTIASIDAPRVLDLGTGSGVIAIAIAHQRPDACVMASDCSEEALALAAANAKRLLPCNRPGRAIHFIASHWFDTIDNNKYFDVIISNPPYIASDDPHLNEGDLRFEPRSALTDGANGLQALAAVIAGSPARLKTGGTLWLEQGYNQAEAVQTLLRKHGFQFIQSVRDSADIQRASGGQYW